MVLNFNTGIDTFYEVPIYLDYRKKEIIQLRKVKYLRITISGAPESSIDTESLSMHR